MLRPYAEPTLERYGAIRDLTREKEGKEQMIADGTGVHETCEEHGGGAAGCPIS
jgi:hypothetical protein